MINLQTPKQKATKSLFESFRKRVITNIPISKNPGISNDLATLKEVATQYAGSIIVPSKRVNRSQKGAPAFKARIEVKVKLLNTMSRNAYYHELTDDQKQQYMAEIKRIADQLVVLLEAGLAKNSPSSLDREALRQLSIRASTVKFTNTLSADLAPHKVRAELNTDIPSSGFSQAI